MKKKIITLAMAAVMTFAFSITSVAAPSATATTEDGTEVAISSETAGISADDFMGHTDEEVAEFINLAKEEGKNLLDQGFITEEEYAEEIAFYDKLAARADQLATAATENNVEVVKTILIDLEPVSNEWKPGDDIRIKVEGLGIKEGDKVLVNHLSYTTGEWETFLADAVADDVIVIKGVQDFSPFMISKVTVKAAAETPADTTTKTPAASTSTATAAAAVASTATATSTATSPKTGFSVLKAVVDLF